MQEKFEEMVDSFITHKIGVSDLFLTSQLAHMLQKHIGRLHEDGQMEPAGIGNGAATGINGVIRSDKIHWLDKKNNNYEELDFLDYVENFISYLNRTCYTGINAYEFHYALYEKGTFYKRHKDQFRSDNNRKYSLISYLNDDWTDADGGQLWIHQDGEVQKILPNNRKAVFFESNELEHEVTTALRSRMSITGWLKRV